MFRLCSFQSTTVRIHSGIYWKRKWNFGRFSSFNDWFTSTGYHNQLDCCFISIELRFFYQWIREHAQLSLNVISFIYMYRAERKLAKVVWTCFFNYFFYQLVLPTGLFCLKLSDRMLKIYKSWINSHVCSLIYLTFTFHRSSTWIFHVLST